MRTAVQWLARDESGATAIEYGLIAALLSIAIIGGVSATGVSIQGFFTYVSTQVSSVVPTP
jgi:pilus assembly protein Flp/PilA